MLIAITFNIIIYLCLLTPPFNTTAGQDGGPCGWTPSGRPGPTNQQLHHYIIIVVVVVVDTTSILSLIHISEPTRHS